MVARAVDRAAARLLPGRGQAGRRYWIFREGLFGDGRGGAPDWFCTGCSADARGLIPGRLRRARNWCRIGDMPPPPIPRAPFVELGVDHALFLPARRVGRDRAGAARARARHGRDRHRRPQHAGRRGADAQRRQGRGAEAADRLPAGPDRCAESLLAYPHRPRRLWPAVAAAQPGQDARRQGRVRR